MISSVMVFSFVYGETHMLLTRYVAEDQEREHDWYAGYEDLDNIDAILPENPVYRIDSNIVNNYNIPLGLSTESFFSSTVSPGIFSFYRDVGRGRTVKTLEGLEQYAFRSLLSTKYVLVGVGEEDSWNAEVSNAEITVDESNAGNIGELLNDKNNFSKETITPTEWGEMWSEYGRTNETIVYENMNFVPMGFTFDYYITPEQLVTVGMDKRSNLLLKALVLTDEQIEKYGDKLQQITAVVDEMFTKSGFVWMKRCLRFWRIPVTVRHMISTEGSANTVWPCCFAILTGGKNSGSGWKLRDRRMRNTANWLNCCGLSV